MSFSLGELILLVMALAGFAALGMALRLAYRRMALKVQERTHVLGERQLVHYQETEAYAQLLHLLQPKAPLPPMRDHAISPSLGVLYWQLLMETQPKAVIEAGSGISTLIAATYCQRRGHGHVYALDHDPHYGGLTQALLRRHGLEAWATVVLAPHKTYTVASEDYVCYDVDQLPADLQADLLLVDGPIFGIHRLPRYAVLPLLKPRLSPKAVVLMDDADRPHEVQTRDRWLAEDPAWTLETVRNEKGAAILRRQPTA